MAEEGIFIGWGQVVRGREQRALEVFNSSVEYWGNLQSDGKIEDFEVVLLTPHGGDLDGFALLRGSGEQLDALRRDEEFERRSTEVDQIVDNHGIVNASLGEGLARAMGIYQEEIAKL